MLFGSREHPKEVERHEKVDPTLQVPLSDHRESPQGHLLHLGIERHALQRARYAVYVLMIVEVGKRRRQRG
jgi:hypothetical protein